MVTLYVCNVRNQHGGGDEPEPLPFPRLFPDGPLISGYNASDWPDVPPVPSGTPNATRAATGVAQNAEMPEPLVLPSWDSIPSSR